MARPKQVLYTDSSDLSQLQPGDSSSSRTVRRISSYCRPLPVPSGVATGATSSPRAMTFVHPPSVPQGPRARTSTLSLRSSASCTTLTTTKASVTRVRRQPSSGLSLSLSIPPTTPTRPTSSIVTTTNSSSCTTAIPTTNILAHGRQPTSPVSPTSPPISPTLLSSSHMKRRKPRSAKIPCGIDESSASSSSDEEGGGERYGRVLPGSRLMTGFGAFSSRGGVPARRGVGGSGVEVVSGGGEAESAGGGSGRVMGAGSSSLASTSASRSIVAVPGEFKRTIITGVVSSSAPAPTSSLLPPPSSFSLLSSSSSTPSASLSSSQLRPPLIRKSQSRLNLRQSSSHLTLRPKRSKPSLLSLVAPSSEVLAYRARNTDPSKVFINRLPNELLVFIFLLLISPSSSSSSSSTRSSSLASSSASSATDIPNTKSARTVSQVCHLWRRIAINEPLLWSRTLNLREGPKWIVETLKRSGECPIDVIGVRSSDGSSRLGFIPRDHGAAAAGAGAGAGAGPGGGRGSVLEVVLNELKRIRRLHLTIERKEEWRVVVDVLAREEAPLLESLAIKSCVRRVANVPPGSNGHMYGNFGAGGEDFGFGFGVGFGVGEGADGSLPMKLTETLFQGGKAPKLKSISLSMVSLNTNKPIPYLGSLTTLQITELEDAYQMSIWAWLDIVRQTPQLHTLILRSTFSPDEPPPSPPPSSPTLSHSSNGTLSHNVVLKKLKFIELKGALMECCEFLEKLVVPGECRLMMGCSRANNVNAVRMLGGWLKERKMRSEQMEGILKTPLEVLWECERERRRGRCLLVHPSVAGLSVRVNEGGGSTEQEGLEREGEGEEDEGECVVNLDLTFGFTDQSEERHRLVIEIFDVLTSALQVVYEDKGGFDALNLSLFGVRDGMRFWRDELTRFLGSLDRVEHLQEMSGYTASVVFPLLVQSPHLHQRRGSAASVISTTSTSPAERFRQNMLLPSLSRITLAFVEFAKNVDDEFEASCDVHAVPDFVKRRYGLGKEVGGISVVRQRVGSVKVRFECCSGPKSILDELRRLGVEYGLGWACDFDE